jgi:hypothetical protein
MMQEDDPKLTPEEELRIENELKALNLELKHGGITHFSDDVPPEIINQWLSNVTTFEEEFKTAAKITVFEKMGKPKFASLDLLEDSTLPGEIERLEQMLFEHGVAVSKPDRIGQEEYYRFLTEDVFNHEMPDTTVPDMFTLVDYDMYYPEVHEVIREFADEILLDLLNLDKPFKGGYFSQYLRNSTDAITPEQVLQTISDFRASYQKIIPVAFQPEQMMGDASCLYFIFMIRWEGIPKSGKDKKEHEGMGVMQFAQEDGEWKLQGVQMPGFEF